MTAMYHNTVYTENLTLTQTEMELEAGGGEAVIDS